MWPAAWPSVVAVAGGQSREMGKPEPKLDDPATYYDWSNGGAWVDAVITQKAGMKTDERIQGESRYLLSSAHTGTGGQVVFMQGTSALGALVAAQLASGSVLNAHDKGRV